MLGLRGNLMNETEFKSYIKIEGEVLFLQHWIGYAIAHDKDIVILIEFDTSTTSVTALKELRDSSQKEILCYKKQLRKMDEEDTDGNF